MSLILLVTFAVVLIAGLAIVQSVLRGKAHLRVLVHFDPKLKRVLTLVLYKNQPKEADSAFLDVSNRSQYTQRLKQKGQWARRVMGKTNEFRDIAARQYYVYLYNAAPLGQKDVVDSEYLVQEIALQKGQTKDLVFQLEKQEANVSIIVRKAGVEIVGAEIQVDQNSNTIYSRKDGAFVGLKKGEHLIKVMYQGKLAEHRFKVDTMDDLIVDFDIDRPNNPVHASVETAQQKPSAGQKEADAKARELINQRKFREAAEIYQSIGDTQKASGAYARQSVVDGDFVKAGELFEQANELKKAAMAFAKAGLYDRAIPIFQKLGEGEIVKELMKRLKGSTINEALS